MIDWDIPEANLSSLIRSVRYFITFKLQTANTNVKFLKEPLTLKALACILTDSCQTGMTSATCCRTVLQHIEMQDVII